MVPFWSIYYKRLLKVTFSLSYWQSFAFKVWGMLKFCNQRWQVKLAAYLPFRNILKSICKIFKSKNIKGIHLYLPSTLWAEFLSQCEDISLIIWFSGPDCESHLKGKSKNLQYVRVRIFSQILDICLVHSIQFFIFISKI